MLLTRNITIQFQRYTFKYPWFLRARLRVIPNAIGLSTSDNFMRFKNANFLFAGRFSFQKQPIRLIEAFKIHIFNFPESKLRMFGRGEQLVAMENSIEMNGLNGKVHIFPPLPEIKDVFAQGNILCIPSIWEGFPNVLGEALAYGIPAIGFKNCDGVSDLILDEENGWLEEDDSTIESLVKLLDRAAMSISSGANLEFNCKASVENYSEERVGEMWNHLITKVSK